MVYSAKEVTVVKKRNTDNTKLNKNIAYMAALFILLVVIILFIVNLSRPEAQNDELPQQEVGTAVLIDTNPIDENEGYTEDSATITLNSNGFFPYRLVALAGSTVTWVAEEGSGVACTIVLESESDEQLFTGAIDTGISQSYELTETGQFLYSCTDYDAEGQIGVY